MGKWYKSRYGMLHHTRKEPNQESLDIWKWREREIWRWWSCERIWSDKWEEGRRVREMKEMPQGQIACVGPFTRFSTNIQHLNVYEGKWSSVKNEQWKEDVSNWEATSKNTRRNNSVLKATRKQHLNVILIVINLLY